MFLYNCRYLLTTQHPRDFANPLVAVYRKNPRPGPAALDLLRHHEMTVAPHRALRKMRDRDDLSSLRRLAHLPSHDRPRLAADVRVDLVEDKGPRRLAARLTTFSASITRAISPELAIAASGRAASPGFGSNM